MTHPLRFDPGKKWIYGFGIDWAGILITRLNNCSLGDYFQKHIFDPLNMNDTTFHPLRNPSIKERLATISIRGSDGVLQPGSIDVWLQDSEEVEMESGGYGLYCTPADYMKFLQALLPSSQEQQTNNPSILTEETLQEMFRPQLPSANWLTENAVDPRGISISGNVMFPSSPVNHGLGMIIHDTDLTETGARKGTAEGAGMTNTLWWVDRTSGVAGICFLNLLPYKDSQAVQLGKEYQAEVYRSLMSSR